MQCGVSTAALPKLTSDSVDFEQVIKRCSLMLPAEACLFLFEPTISIELKTNTLLPKNVGALLERQSKEFLTSSHAY